MNSKYPLLKFAWFPSFDDALEELATLAMDEDWDYKHTETDKKYPILFNYIHHTFSRLTEENKIEVQGKHAIFNTGLATDKQEEIFAFFNENKMSDTDIPWFFLGFKKESDRDLLKFDNLPECANYFEEPKDLIYDTRLDLRVDYDHIIDDNRGRFPSEFSNMSNYQLKIFLEGAVREAIQRVKRNYKTAIPQFFNNKIQLLLPLRLSSERQADLALAVEKQGNNYRVVTCLTLDMAFNNARLIAKPDDEWLKP